MNPIIYTTRDQGRLHIAFDKYYQSSVNSYNNFVTRIFSKLFRMSTDVMINNKKFCLNKISYVKLLQLMGKVEASLSTLNNFRDFNSLSLNLLDNGLMREHLSQSKADQIGRKLVSLEKSISTCRSNDLNLFQKYLGKGASVDQDFWIRENDGQTIFDRDVAAGLPHQHIDPFKATKYNPFLYAKVMNRDDLGDLLQHYGANPFAPGETIIFERQLMRAENHTSLETNYRYGYHHRGHYHPGHIGVDVVTRQRLSFRDKSTKINKLVYDQFHNCVFAINQTPKTHVENWRKENLVSSNRLI